MTPRHFLRFNALSAGEFEQLLTRAAALKATRRTHEKRLAGKSVALFFEKPSTRTRVSFEVGVHELGGHAVVIPPRDSQVGRGESVADTARTLSRYIDALVVRTFEQERLEELAQHATVPVVNALTDLHHPCQVLADLLTVRENKGSFASLKFAWIGDGNNMANAWIDAARLLDFHIVLACPPGYDPDPEVLGRPSARLRVVRDPMDAVDRADVVSTDVWASMGQEEEHAKRLALFSRYQVNEKLIAGAKPDAIFLHCLPAHRGEEVSAAVIDGPRSRVWDQAENRLHTQKALLEFLLLS
ncbi:MAG: ornithine carbamoyltransferase [Deltaproteobacteria bacterium]|nr:ornithine carbamoyltransferase [Deltaproteobacteria bacterium]